MKRNPMIARRCPKVWTDAEEHEMVDALVALRGDIDAAGGLDAWVQGRLDQWLPKPDVCRPIPHRFTTN